MMSDHQFQISLTTALAWLLWAVVAACVVASYFDRNWWVAATGSSASCAAATLHVRSFFVALSSRMKSAFDLGREVEREQQASLHSVR